MVLQVPNAFCALVAAAFLAGTVVATPTTPAPDAIVAAASCDPPRIVVDIWNDPL